MKITTTHTIEEQELAYMLDCAGRGARYWAQSELEYESTVKKLLRGKTIKITDIEEEKTYEVSRARVENGLILMAQKMPQSFADLLTGDYDDNTGDSLLQMIIFGEIVYG